MSGSVIFSWAQFWAYFTSKDTPLELRVAMWKDLRMKEFLERIPASAQIEVLQEAPDKVKQELKSVLKLEAKTKLGVSKVYEEFSDEELRAAYKRAVTKFG